jgi:tripeptidyl-peptidase-1
VTSVGGTTGSSPETAASFSAGGFSNMFTRPTYQDSSATAFLSTIPPDFPGVFARGGRGYPDVSLQSRNYQTIEGGSVESELGTSASAPTFASMIALLNAQLMADGHASLGFLNRESRSAHCVRHPPM